MVSWLRRGIQLGALGLLLAVPALNYGGILYQQYGKNGYHKISLTGTVFEQWLYHLFSITVGRLTDPAVRSMDWVGNFGSFSIFGFPILDPVVAAETVLRSPRCRRSASTRRTSSVPGGPSGPCSSQGWVLRSPSTSRCGRTSSPTFRSGGTYFP